MTTGSLSVLHVIAPAKFGGMESVVASLAAGHTRRGHSVRVAAVLSPGHDPHPFIESLKAEGVKVVPLHPGDRDYGAERSAIRALCRKYHPDVVHTHGYRPDVVDGRVARAEDIVVVSTCHGFIESSWRGRGYQWLQRRALRHFDAVVAVSPTIASTLRASGVPGEKIHLLFNAIAEEGKPLSREAARQLLELPDAKVIGWVGRLSAEKGADIALEALARLDDASTRLLIIGAGPEETMLRHRAAALGVGQRVLWRGALPNAKKLFPAFDAFLLSSRTEGAPMALLEAMAAGVPIVAARVGGVSEVVDAASAWLVPGRDSEAMARSLEELFSKPEVAQARARRARERLDERFAVEPWLSRYESIYRSVLRR